MFSSTAKLASVFLFVCLVIEITFSSNVDPGETANVIGVTGTLPVQSLNITTNSTETEKDDDSSKGNKGAIIAVIVVGVFVCAAVIVGVVLFKRRRQSMMMDKEKKMQIQMSSARNAGVYQDLTVSVPADEKPPASPEHERLKAAEEA
ncbi:uncharacterized protein LOC106061444 [Biomphalaria glabrata]|uniref:Uncharacterized protein LOC106061444 n=1 Tax=Biomphalaria glabrata TaxID=6526 RepID=A0A9W3B5Y9_BIOGL|nr:uncharacterized protein LOC106061444 [Biomphalaria glabrata]XP_055894888.1 uncharacterized protein LOC106061444 [Biomphalaria glabrata]XP_055894889.1 uncharacterized protein LOC106061444 [Biomphalaria glabrata]XP_055894890.1 uncharacterized protein LOC106061444 [Biomphalaria glabrata]XP_055894892.1 uncharacterized protein LOC106061444 [Biomphalaria glabrata]